MHSLLQRVNIVTATVTTGLMVLLPLLAFSGYYMLPTPLPTASINVDNVRVVHGSYDPMSFQGGAAKDHIFADMSMDADLTPLFNWNTKQLYINLVAEYETKTHGVNQVTVWDKLVMSPEAAKIELRNQGPLYAFTDIRRHLNKGQQVRLSLQWNVVPWVGPMVNGRQSGEGATFKLPVVGAV